MEENKNQVTAQTNSNSTADNKKGSNNTFMLFIILGLLVVFGLMVYTITKNKEVDNVWQKPASVLIMPKSVNTRQSKVEGADSVDVGNPDTDIQDLSTDVQGL